MAMAVTAATTGPATGPDMGIPVDPVTARPVAPDMAIPADQVMGAVLATASGPYRTRGRATGAMVVARVIGVTEVAPTVEAAEAAEAAAETVVAAEAAGADFTGSAWPPSRPRFRQSSTPPGQSRRLTF